jgi:uncharacterized FlaG/YvyC family protein
MVSHTSSEIFKNLKEDSENNKCIECSSENPTFTSVNNGCLICTNCVSLHLPLGPQVSRVKAIEDSWTEDELKLMIAGGNSSLKEFFSHYGLISSPPNVKYLTRAAFFYRDMLAVVAQDREYEENCPSTEDGVKIILNEYPEMPSLPCEEGKNEEILKQDKNNEHSAWDWAKNAYHKTVTASSKAVERIGEKLDKLAEKPAIRNVENKTIEIAGKVEAGLSNVVNKVYSKPEVQKTVEHVNKAADVFSQGVGYTYTKISSNPTVQKVKMDTMNLLKDFGDRLRK